MAQDTYLEMVSDMIMETGLNGGAAPSTIATASGDAQKVTYWIRVADLQLQRERIDWDFLWENPIVPLTQSSRLIPTPVNRIGTSTTPDPRTDTALVNAVAKDRLAVINSNGEAYFPQYMKWNEFSILYNYESQQESDYPSFWSMSPDRQLMFSEPVISSDLACKYEYWRKPVRLREDADVSRIPDDFSRLILLLAKTLYAEHEDAPEVDAGSTANYDLMFNQMLSVHAPEAEWQRMENSDQYLAVETR